MSLVNVRYVLVFAFLLALFALTLPAPAWAEDEEPLRAWILDINVISIESIAVLEGQGFTLLGVATGGCVPYHYVWKEGEQILGAISVLTFVYSEPGDHTIELIVTDILTQVATDTVHVSVLPSPVSVGASTWGAIKELFR
jgi:hypothetical protein